MDSSVKVLPYLIYQVDNSNSMKFPSFEIKDLPNGMHHIKTIMKKIFKYEKKILKSLEKYEAFKPQCELYSQPFDCFDQYIRGEMNRKQEYCTYLENRISELENFDKQYIDFCISHHLKDILKATTFAKNIIELTYEASELTEKIIRDKEEMSLPRQEFKGLVEKAKKCFNQRDYMIKKNSPICEKIIESDRDKLEIFIEKAYDITCHFMSFLANQSDCLIQEVLPFQSSLQEELRKRTPRLLLSTTKRIITTTSKISFNLKDIINLEEFSQNFTPGTRQIAQLYQTMAEVEDNRDTGIVGSFSNNYNNSGRSYNMESMTSTKNMRGIMPCKNSETIRTGTTCGTMLLTSDKYFHRAEPNFASLRPNKSFNGQFNRYPQSVSNFQQTETGSRIHTSSFDDLISGADKPLCHQRANPLFYIPMSDNKPQNALPISNDNLSLLQQNEFNHNAQHHIANGNSHEIHQDSSVSNPFMNTHYQDNNDPEGLFNFPDLT